MNYLLLHVRSLFLNRPSVKDNESDKICSKFPWRLSAWVQVIVLQIHKTHIGQLCALFLFTVQNKGMHTYLTYFVNSFSLSSSCTAYFTGSKLTTLVSKNLHSDFWNVSKDFSLWQCSEFCTEQNWFSKHFQREHLKCINKKQGTVNDKVLSRL